MEEPRPLSEVETALVTGLHTLNGLPMPDDDTLRTLRVVGRCDCGCASVDFHPDVGPASVIADGYGVTPSGAEVGLILWEREGQPSGLEIYMLGTDTSELPNPASLHRGDGAPAS